MKVLVADDEAIFRKMVRSVLARAGHDVVEAAAGDEALSLLRAVDAPPMAILDWMMPGLDGVGLCRAVRAQAGRVSPYLILLTSKDRREDIVSGLEAGADDYLTKPFDSGELRARVHVGERILGLQQALADPRGRAGAGAHPRQPPRGAAADLRVVPQDPRRRQLLAERGALRLGALRRALHSHHLPRLSGHGHAHGGDAVPDLASGPAR